MVTNVVFVLITSRNFEIPPRRSSVGVTESNIYENSLNYEPTYIESLLDGFRHSLVLSKSLSYRENYTNFYIKFKKKEGKPKRHL